MISQGNAFRPGEKAENRAEAEPSDARTSVAFTKNRINICSHHNRATTLAIICGY